MCIIAIATEITPCAICTIPKHIQCAINGMSSLTSANVRLFMLDCEVRVGGAASDCSCRLWHNGGPLTINVVSLLFDPPDVFAN